MGQFVSLEGAFVFVGFSLGLVALRFHSAVRVPPRGSAGLIHFTRLSDKPSRRERPTIEVADGALCFHFCPTLQPDRPLCFQIFFFSDLRDPCSLSFLSSSLASPIVPYFAWLPFNQSSRMSAAVPLVLFNFPPVPSLSSQRRSVPASAKCHSTPFC